MIASIMRIENNKNRNVSLWLGRFRVAALTWNLFALACSAGDFRPFFVCPLFYGKIIWLVTLFWLLAVALMIDSLIKTKDLLIMIQFLSPLCQKLREQKAAAKGRSKTQSISFLLHNLCCCCCCSLLHE